ncbi:hypothetical protein [Prosthecobacter sp.]|uniref:hypothetical protein n=1 Tax=Prosthecobacter sp. TaxID=1965333 RepID=UPI00378307F7
MSESDADPWVYTRGKIEEAISQGDAERLRCWVVAVSMYDADASYAEDLCLRLSNHPDEIVRGNAILGFGHIARVHRRLDEERVKPLIVAAFLDSSWNVTGHAFSAREDTQFFLGWKFEPLDKQSE